MIEGMKIGEHHNIEPKSKIQQSERFITLQRLSLLEHASHGPRCSGISLGTVRGTFDDLQQGS